MFNQTFPSYPWMNRLSTDALLGPLNQPGTSLRINSTMPAFCAGDSLHAMTCTCHAKSTLFWPNKMDTHPDNASCAAFATSRAKVRSRSCRPPWRKDAEAKLQNPWHALIRFILSWLQCIVILEETEHEEIKEKGNVFGLVHTLFHSRMFQDGWLYSCTSLDVFGLAGCNKISSEACSWICWRNLEEKQVYIWLFSRKDSPIWKILKNKKSPYISKTKCLIVFACHIMNEGTMDPNTKIRLHHFCHNEQLCSENGEQQAVPKNSTPHHTWKCQLHASKHSSNSCDVAHQPAHLTLKLVPHGSAVSRFAGLGSSRIA